jgi:[acyl-carrier-protein] S-malonyltransferase
MAEVAESVPGTMAAVLGMDRATVIALLDGADGVWVANDNGAGQVVLSGTHAGIEWATAALGAAGARKIVPLNVAGPFHSPLMEPARDAFADVLDGSDIADTRFPVIQNTVPEPTSEAETLRSRLTAQITAPVRWTETMDALLGSGIETVVETGPGSVLTGLARRVEGMTAISIEADGIERVLEVVSR